MNLAHWLERVAVLSPDAPALYLGQAMVADYAGFWRHAAGIGAGLVAQGVGPGDRVALFMKNRPEYLEALFGIWVAGAVAVPINAKLHPKEAAFILEHSGAGLVFVAGALGDDLATASDIARIDVGGAVYARLRDTPAMAIHPRGRDDLAWLFYTSGTTGRPKGVEITHGMLQAMSLSYLADVDEVSPKDGAYYMAPMSHGAGLYALVHVLRGARHICPASGGFDAGELLADAEALGPLSMFMAPTMVRRLTDAAQAHGTKGEGIKTIVYGGGPMYVSDIEEAVDLFGPRFVQIYGQGECPMTITVLSRELVADRSHPRWRERLGSVGRAHSVVEVAISDGTGGFAAPGEAGEIMVRGAPVMPGYWQAPEATVTTLKDGWLMTGDLGFLDEDGFLTLRDRSKDVIISGGTNIYPREVEEALLTHDSVREASVIGRPHPEWGEEVVAFVVTSGDLDTTALDAHCLTQIARFKRPKAYYRLENLPKNNYGKVLKTALRDKLKEME